MKKFVMILIAISLLIPITGCWNSRELDKLGFVQAIGIDRTEDKQIQVSFQILKPRQMKSSTGGGGGEEKAVWIATSEGETVSDAVRNVTAMTERRLNFSQITVVILGEDVAKEGIIPFLDGLNRNAEPRLTSYCFVARGKALDILKAENEQQSIPAVAMEGLARANAFTSKRPTQTRLIDVIKTLYSDTSDLLLAGISSFQSEESGKKKDLLKSAETAIFKKDKLIGWFNGEETRGVLWVLGEVKSGIIVLESPSAESAKLSILIVRASSKIIPEMIDDKLTLTVDIKVQGSVGEEMDGMDLTKSDSIKELNKKVEVSVREEVNSALSKAQKWGVDIFRFGEETHKKLPKEWPVITGNWTKEFQNLEVIVNVEAEVLGVGRVSNAIGKRND